MEIQHDSRYSEQNFSKVCSIILRYFLLLRRKIYLLKVARNEKRKYLLGFSFYINIENFEAYLCRKTLSTNLFFLKSVK